MQHDFCVLSLLTFKVVLMTWRLAHTKVLCSLLCDEWRIRMLEINIECSLKWKNRYWIWITHKGSFYVVNVTSRSCSLFHANKCIFSRKGLKAMAIFFKTVTSVLSGILILLFLSLLLLTIFLLNLPNLNCTFFFRSVAVFVWTNDTFSVFWCGRNNHVSFSKRKHRFLISYHHTKKKAVYQGTSDRC